MPGASESGGERMPAVCARVLRVLRDGASTSVVAQMLHSNAVLKFAVGGWRQAEGAGDCCGAAPRDAAAATNARKSNHRKHAQTRPRCAAARAACAPPEITVEVARAEGVDWLC